MSTKEKQRGARVAFAWRTNATVDSNDARPRADADARAFALTRSKVHDDLNVFMTKKTSVAIVMTIFRASASEGDELERRERAVSAERARRVPDEFATVEFKNPDTRCVVCARQRAERMTDVEDDTEIEVFSAEREVVNEFMASAEVRFHRAARRYVAAGDAFATGDFIVRLLRVETGSGTYVGMILDVLYKATEDVACASVVLREFAEFASASANASGIAPGAFVASDFASACPLDVYRAPAGDLQLAISYIEALKLLLAKG